MFLYKLLHPFFAYTQVFIVKEPNFWDCSCTKRAPRLRNGRDKKSGHRHWPRLFSNYPQQKHFYRIGPNAPQNQPIYKHIYMYMYIHIYLCIYIRSHTRKRVSAIVKQDTLCRNLCASSAYLRFKILYITFWTKARHFRVRGRYVLERLESYKMEHWVQRITKTINKSGFR